MDNLNTTGYIVNITLSDGTTINLTDKHSSVSNLVNYVTSAKVKENMFADNKNPVGVISANTVKLEITSNDRSLIPSNNNSIYYGKMNDSAIITVYTLNSENTEDEPIYLGRYYVSTWTGGTNSNNKYKVTIEGTDILGRIMKMQLSYMDLLRSVKVKDFLKWVQDTLNGKLEQKYRFNFKFDDTYKFDTLSFTNIEATDVGTMLNTICQSLIVNIFVDRTATPDIGEYGNIITVRDATKTDGIGNRSDINDVDNIFYAGSGSGNLVNYSGVKLNYIRYSISESKSIAKFDNINVSKSATQDVGTTVNINNLSLGGKCYKVTGVILDTNCIGKADNTGSGVYVGAISYNKSNASLNVTNYTTQDIVANLNILGQELVETKLFIEKTLENNSNDVLEITNKLIGSDNTVVENFRDELINILKRKSNSLEIKGIFNPSTTTLCKNVIVNCTNTLNTNARKCIITGLEWDLGADLRCTIHLIDGGGVNA